MEIRQLRTFMSIVKLGSFSEAARQQGYTQSSVTSHIQLLEKELGVALFERLGHALMLTSAGEQLYSYAEKIIRLDDETHAALQHNVEPAGILRVGISESITRYRLENILTEYALLYPNVELHLTLGTNTYFQDLIRKNVLDLACCLEENIQEKDLTVYKLWPETIGLIVAPSHPLAGKKLINAHFLAGETIIVTEINSKYTEVLTEELEKAKVNPLRLLEIEQLHAAKTFAQKGLGIAVLPLIAVREEIAKGTLCALDLVETPWKMHAFMFHHKDKWLAAPLKLFMKLVWERLPLGKEVVEHDR